MKQKSSEPKTPYYIPPQQHEQNNILQTLIDVVMALGDAVPKLDGSYTIKTNDDKAIHRRKS